VRVHVKPAHFFVLGDNRPRSCDSRDFGLVPQDYIRGRVEVRIWPPERLGSIDTP
jgi:signal peptidase I